MARKRLGEILIQAGVLDESKLRAALAEQQRWGGQLGKILVEMKLISEEALVQALSHQLNLPAVLLEGREIASKVLELVPQKLCEEHGVIPFAIDGKFLDVAMADPTNMRVLDELRIETRLNVRAYLSGPQTIERAIRRHYQGHSSEVEEPAHAILAAGPTSDPSSVQGIFAMSVPLTDVSRRRASSGKEAPDGGGPEADEGVADLRARLEQLEAVVARDEDVIRKLMGLLIEKGMCTREELVHRMNRD